MAATPPLKKPPYMKQWMAQADARKEASTIKKMNGWSLFLSSNKMTHYTNKKTHMGDCKWCFEKKYIVFTKI